VQVEKRMEYDPKLSTVATYVRELLDEKGCTSEESCVVLLDVVTDLIVEYSKGGREKLTACFGEWTKKILDVAIKKSFKKYPPPMSPGIVTPLPPR